jgi:hypothetical protein
MKIIVTWIDKDHCPSQKLKDLQDRGFPEKE